MNYLTHIATAAMLTLLSATGHAETVCNKCEYINFGSYLGAHWPGDRSNFMNTEIASNIGQSRQFDDYWVFDLNANTNGVLIVDTKAMTALDGPFAVEIYADAGSVCGETRCSIRRADLPLISKEAAKRWSAKTDTLVAGRYVIRIASGTRATGESAYSGSYRSGIYPTISCAPARDTAGVNSFECSRGAW